MRVIYEKPIMDQLASVKWQAVKECRRVEYVLLSEREATRLYKEGPPILGEIWGVSLPDFLDNMRGNTSVMVYGMRLKLEEKSI